MSGVTNQIKIHDELYINKGNFAFVFDEFDSDDIGKEIMLVWRRYQWMCGRI